MLRSGFSARWWSVRHASPADDNVAPGSRRLLTAHRANRIADRVRVAAGFNGDIAVIKCRINPHMPPGFFAMGIHCIARFTGTSAFHTAVPVILFELRPASITTKSKPS